MGAASVTCVYSVNATGTKTAAQIATAMGGAIVPLPTWIGPLTGALVTSDIVGVVGGRAVRTIIFNVTPAKFQSRFGTSPLGPFFGIMSLILRAALNQPVIESLPVAA